MHKILLVSALFCLIYGSSSQTTDSAHQDPGPELFVPTRAPLMWKWDTCSSILNPRSMVATGKLTHNRPVYIGKINVRNQLMLVEIIGMDQSQSSIIIDTQQEINRCNAMVLYGAYDWVRATPAPTTCVGLDDSLQTTKYCICVDNMSREIGITNAPKTACIVKKLRYPSKNFSVLVREKF